VSELPPPVDHHMVFSYHLKTNTQIRVNINSKIAKRNRKATIRDVMGYTYTVSERPEMDYKFFQRFEVVRSEIH
jgi:hypothetical protein